VPNAVVRIYLDDREQKIQERVQAAEGWIDARIAQQQERVAQAQAAVKTFRDTEAPSSEDLQGEVSQSITDLLARRATIQASRSGVQATLAALEAAPGLGQAAEAIDSVGMTELRRELQRQEAELAKLLEVYGDNYPSVIDARSRVQETQVAITREAERHIQSLRNQVAAFDRQEETIAAGLSAAEARLARARTIQSRLDELGRDVEVEQKALADLDSQKRSLETRAELPVADVEVLSPASTPRFPIGRGRSFYLLVWLFVSGTLAVTAAFGLELLDRGVRAFEQLGNVPNVRPAGLVPRLPRRLGPVEALKRSRNHFSDALSGVAMTLERAGHGDPPTSLFVTSALPSEGKSTLAFSLAIVLTARGRRVLLVDGDPRHGTVHRSLGAEATPGLSDFLAGRSDLPAVIRRNEALGIDFVPRGSQAIALHDVGRARELMSYAREQGMTVIVDGPPALATTETLALAGFVERNLLVARWGKTTRREVELAVRRLHEWNLDEVFLVLNRVNVDRYPLYGFKDSGLFAKELRKYYGPLG
jgi:Mrp family chromosome partitioning ATPase